MRRLAVRVDGDDDGETARLLEGSRPAAGELLRAAHLAAARPRVVDGTDDGSPLAEAAADEGLRAAGSAVQVVARLRARGRTLGVLRLSRSRGRFAAVDVDIVGAIADRAGIELDNAGLSSELAAAERRLRLALDGMPAAVLVQRPGRGIVYANEAAAKTMGLESAADVVAATPEEIAGEWISYNEDGSPLRVEQFPSRKILTGEDLDPPPIVTRGVHRVTGEEKWLLVTARAIHDARGDVEMAVSVSEDITALKRAGLAQRVLAEAGAALSSSLEYERTLQEVAHLAVPELADWCSVTLPGEGRELRQAAVAHRDPEKVAFAREYAARFPAHADDPAGVAEVLRTGVSQLITEIPDELLVATAADPERLEMLRRVGIRSVILAALVAPGGTAVGVLSLINAESGRVFTSGDLALAEEIGRRAGVAIENARLYTERSRIAATLQTSLFPEELPPIPGVRLASAYRPAGEENWVGGDFYDAFETAAGWMVVVGDVVGQGAAAAALTAQARHTLRSAGMLTGDPAAAVAHLNELLLPHDGLALCTVCVVLLPADSQSPVAQVVSAGHPLPIVVRDGVAAEAGEPGPLVGAWEAEHRATAVPLAPGDLLVVHTDGVTDARRDDALFGEERLHAALAPAAGATDAIRRVEAALDSFQRGRQADDMAIVAVERVAVPAPAHRGAPT